MGLSLRDQLLQAGFAQSKPEPRPAPVKPPERSGGQQDRHSRSGRPLDRAGRPANERHAGKDAAARQPSRPNPQAQRPPKPERQPDPNREPSLAAAYNARAETETSTRETAQRLAQEEAQRKREQRLKLAAAVAGKGVNQALSEHTRNFLYGKKIRKVNVTAEQFLQLNAGDLGVVQVDGRFLILPAATVREALVIGRQYVALFVPEGIGASGNADEDYSDPRFQVPDDLVW